MWVGIDDTDSPEGGCTTWVLTELCGVARELGVDLVGEPRLVRLNPNVPWKTRGNAALAMHVGHGRGTPTVVGELEGRGVLAFPRGRPLDRAEARRFEARAWERVTASAPRRPGTDPAMVTSASRLPSRLYWRAVREVVRLAPVTQALVEADARCRVRSGRRGLIGASAAIAWPGRRATWEVLAYRRPERFGLPREVDRASVLEAEKAEPDLFLCHDDRTRRLLVAPHTPCPILFGLRSRSPDAAVRARSAVRSEPVDRWMLFRTNQGTGDHLARRRATAVEPLQSGIVAGVVDGPIEVLAGGHVRFELRDAHGDTLSCVAFEPTKSLPNVARKLTAGDRLEVWGSRGTSGGFRLEGIGVVGLAESARWTPPLCQECGRRTRSAGTGRGWRCERCRRRYPLEAGRRSHPPRGLDVGVYHPTRSARRHLAPLGP